MQIKRLVLNRQVWIDWSFSSKEQPSTHSTCHCHDWRKISSIISSHLCSVDRPPGFLHQEMSSGQSAAQRKSRWAERKMRDKIQSPCAPGLFRRWGKWLRKAPCKRRFQSFAVSTFPLLLADVQQRLSLLSSCYAIACLITYPNPFKYFQYQLRIQ